MNYLLSDGDTIPLNPNLAKEIGVNHALVLQQLHFLLTVTRKQRRQYNYVEGRWWIYNTYPEWRRDHFKWLSVSAIKSIFRELEEAGLVMSMQSVKSKFDRRKWYSINYEAFERLASSIRQILSDENRQFLSDENGQNLSDVYTETTPETTSEKVVEPSSSKTDEVPLKPDAFRQWERHFGALTPMTAEHLKDMVKDYGDTRVCREILDVSLNPPDGPGIHPNYIAAIIRRKDAEAKRKKAKAKSASDAPPAHVYKPDVVITGPADTEADDSVNQEAGAFKEAAYSVVDDILRQQDEALGKNNLR